MAELVTNEETGVLELITTEIVSYDESGPVYEEFPVFYLCPARPGSPEHREAIRPYVEALILFFDRSPDDINF